MTEFAKTFFAAAVAVVLLAPAAQAQQGQSQAQQGSDMKGMDMKGMDMKPMMRKNSEKMMSMPTTGKPDVDFAMMMREHHQAGIEMAQWELEHGSDPKLKDIARKMISEQKKDVEGFDGFLAKSGQSTSMGSGPSK